MSPSPTLLRAAIASAVAVVLTTVAAPALADDVAPVQETHQVTASDGVKLTATVTGQGSIEPRPTLVEFSPYGRDSGTLAVGPEFNTLLVQIRGTGDSKGSFDALGPRTQKDVREVLQWACDQPWSDGKLAINGFSASAITIYNSLHQELPCVKAMVLRSGTHSLYRDLLVPGGISNLGPAAGVMVMIGAPALIQADSRINDAASGLEALLGLATTGVQGGFLHNSLDAWWQDRQFRGNANHIPTLVINGFFDVESRGAFEGYQELRSTGAHLLVVGAHDGAPVGTDDGVPEANLWLDHYVRGVDNGVETHPRVQMLLSRGDREDYLAGDFTARTATDWPVPGTKWTALHLASDKSLSKAPQSAQKTALYATIPSLPTATDIPTTALLGAAGLNAVTNSLPILTDMTLADPLGLTYTTAPLTEDVTSAGPLALKLSLATVVPGTGIWAVVSDVSPDGTAHPLTAGRLNTNYPGVIESKSLKDDQGRIVQPFGDYEHSSLAPVLGYRPYQVEFWPVGNVFEKGHRLRVSLVGTSALSRPSLPSVNIIKLGGADGAQLLVPALPGSDLAAALPK